MKNRREFLGGCAAAATVMAMPAAGAILAPVKSSRADAYDLSAFTALRGERVPLREGGSVTVAEVEPIGADPRCEQFVVRALPSTPMESGIYHLETAAGSRALYLESGESAKGPTLTAAVSRLRA